MREYRDYYQGNYSFQKPKGQWVKRIIIANCIVFVLQTLLLMIDPRIYSKFIFTCGLVVPKVIEDLYVWQVFTYMFLHSTESLFHIIFNMMILYFFGPELESRLGGKRFLFLYIAGGVIAGLSYILIYFLTQHSRPVIGASGAIMALVVLYACYYPDRTILFFFVIPMKIKTATILLVAFDLYSSINPGASNNVANIAHLGGALFGYLFYHYEAWFVSFLEGDSLAIFSSTKEEVFDKEDFEERLDEILAKVHEKGLPSLSKKEKKFLKSASKRYKEQR